MGEADEGEEEEIDNNADVDMIEVDADGDAATAAAVFCGVRSLVVLFWLVGPFPVLVSIPVPVGFPVPVPCSGIPRPGLGPAGALSGSDSEVGKGKETGGFGEWIAKFMLISYCRTAAYNSKHTDQQWPLGTGTSDHGKLSNTRKSAQDDQQ